MKLTSGVDCGNNTAVNLDGTINGGGGKRIHKKVTIPDESRGGKKERGEMRQGTGVISRDNTGG